MSLWHQFRRGFKVLAHRRESDAELAAELHDYINRATAAHLANGLSGEAARRAALLEAGSSTSIQDQVRSRTWENALENFAADVRYGARQLLRHPEFAIVAIATLAIGIGATTAIFSAVNPILFEPLPYSHADRVVLVWESRNDGSPQNPAYGTYFGLTGALSGGDTKSFPRSIAFAAVTKPWQPAIVGTGQPERFEGQRVTPDYFHVLGVSPALGRDFASSDDVQNAPAVVIISGRLWKRLFASDPEIVGRQLTLDGSLVTVIGVMPAQFENVLAPQSDIWAPLQYNPALPSDGREWGHHLTMLARLAPRATAKSAANELSTRLVPLTQTYAKGYASSGGPPGGIAVHSMRDDLTAGVRPALLAILGAVLLVLLIACINVTNLVLARGSERRAEFAMRATLGAGRARLIRQMLAEGLLLAFIGGALGITIAQLGVQAIVALSPVDLPRLSAIHIDGTVLAFGLVATTIVGLAVGFLPALHAGANHPQAALQESARTLARSHHFTRRILVVAEVAISLVLLVGAGLLLRSIRKVFAVSPGFDSSHLLTMQVQDSGRRTLPSSNSSSDDHAAFGALASFYDSALESVRAVPGVEAAAWTSQLPLSGDDDVYGIELESLAKGAPSDAAFRYCVSSRYFEAMRIPLRRGRYLDERDKPGAPVAVVVSRSFVTRYFQGADPIGQRLRLGPDAGNPTKPWAVIVGEVGDVKQTGLSITGDDAFYVSNQQWFWFDTSQSLVVRSSSADPASLTRAVKQAVWSVDKDQPVVRVATMGSLVAASEAQRHFAFVLFEIFGLVAVLLAATGIYGVLSGGVSERTREIGIRAAFGASPSNILRLILGQGIALTAVGVTIGIAGAVAASSLLATLLFGVTHLDPVTYAAVTLLLLAVATAACYIPARRAMHLDPISTLRHD